MLSAPLPSASDELMRDTKPSDPSASVAVTWRQTLAMVGFIVLSVLGSDNSWADDAACKQVRMADVGWSDVTATTAVMSVLLQDLGYQPKTTLLSVPVTYSSMQHGDIDLFLGNWMPAQTSNLAPYLKDGSIEIITTNLTGAKYTLAVPDYVFAQGLHDFADIANYAKALDGKIYGIEPGNDGNRHILELISHNHMHLGAFKLVESSEQGMLAEVERAVAHHRMIVFLAWAPHPMNRHFDIRYLTGGDQSFGPDYGSAFVRTLMRPNIASQCPNLKKLASQVQFSVADESELMDNIAASSQPPEVVARAWLNQHPERRAQWLYGIASLDTASGDNLVTKLTESARDIPKLAVGEQINNAIATLKHSGDGGFKLIAKVIQWPVDTLGTLFHAIPLSLILLATVVLSYYFKRSWRLSLFIGCGLLLIINLGFWSLTIDTLALVLVATAFCVLIGVPLGILAAHYRFVKQGLNPLLDLMQTLPSFVYLIPTLVLFGLGTVPAVIATITFAIPAPIRMTELGISQIPQALLEAGNAFGATRWQRLIKIELPAAAPCIYQGITQCIMLALSMVVIAALVGASGLGVPVVRALNTVSVGDGFEAGVVIVLLAIILDRLTRPRLRP